MDGNPTVLHSPFISRPRAASAPASTGRSRSSSWRSQKYGAPVYVRHEIVHNRYVVESLKAKGAVFVEELDEIPDTERAGGVFRAWRAEIGAGGGQVARNLFFLDATCPLVSKVHVEAERHLARAARSC